MPIVKLPSDTVLDAPTVTKLPADTKLEDTPTSSPKPTEGGAFYGAANLLPEGVQKYLPSFVKGPSVGEQLAAERDKVVAESQRLGRPLTLSELTKINPAISSAVAMGFGTHQIGETSALTKGADQKFITDQYTRAVKPTVSG